MVVSPFLDSAVINCLLLLLLTSNSLLPPLSPAGLLAIIISISGGSGNAFRIKMAKELAPTEKGAVVASIHRVAEKTSSRK